jgi:methionyl-tRNA formyltransferase
VELLKIWEAHPMVASAPEGTAAASGEVLVARGDELVVAAREGRETLTIRVLQREGRRRMSTREFLAGGALKPGMRLGV